MSSKPFLITGKDAIFIAAATVLAYLIVIILFYLIMETPDKILTRDNGYALIRTFTTAMIVQYLYEYTGLNEIISESSIRYAKGSTLDKFVSRRHASLYEEYAMVPNKTPAIKNNMHVLKIAASQPSAIAKINEYFCTQEYLSNQANHANYKKDINENELLLIINKTNQHISAKSLHVICALPREQIEVLPVIIKDMDKDIILDILYNGLGQYKPRHTIFATFINDESIKHAKLFALTKLNEVLQNIDLTDEEIDAIKKRINKIKKEYGLFQN